MEDQVSGAEIRKMRVYYPMLVFDGAEESNVTLDGSSVTLKRSGGGARFEVLEPTGLKLQRTGKRLDFRNGQAEGVYAELEGVRAVYRISSVRN